jgi:pimeloyl-ACP methyl ester carboxylesterase
MTRIVLVHRAWHGAWCWDGTAAELGARQIDAIAVEPAARTVPSTYVACSRDGAIPPEAQFQVAQGLDRVVVRPTDHSPFLTRPGDVAYLLELTLTAKYS